MAREVVVRPSNKMFERLGHNNVTFVALMSEFIDNGSAAGATEISITIEGNWVDNKLKLSDATLTVKDNGCGIPFDKIGQALSPAAMAQNSSNSLNEHGLGLKVALCSLGGYTNTKNGHYEGFIIITKTKEEDPYFISELCYDDPISVEEISAKEANLKTESGTVIKIIGLKEKVYQRKEDYSNLVIPQLGAKYQQLLSGTLSGKKLKLTFELRNFNGDIITDKSGQPAKWNIEPIEAYYQNNKPLLNKPLKGGKWNATLMFGPCASEAELIAAGISPPKSKHPYYSLNNKVDLFNNNKLITQVNYEDIGADLSSETINRAFRKSGIRCQIFLHSGFSTSFSKDGIQQDASFADLKIKAWEALKPFFNLYQTKQPEREMMEIVKRQLDAIGVEYQPKYSIEALGIEADLVVSQKNGKEIWELKVGEAGADDLMQLIGYIRYSGNEISKVTGRLIAESFSDCCKSAVKAVKEKDGISVKLVNKEDLRM